MSELARPGVRLDIWLDVACLARTRSEAQRACRLGRVAVNGVTARPHRELRVGDTVAIARPSGRTQVVVVRALTDRHVAKAVARTLYEDRTPPPSPEAAEARRLERHLRAAMTAPRRPDRRERRALRDRKCPGW